MKFFIKRIYMVGWEVNYMSWLVVYRTEIDILYITNIYDDNVNIFNYLYNIITELYWKLFPAPKMSLYVKEYADMWNVLLK